MMTRHRFLMSESRCRAHASHETPQCRFDVAWSINPHMDPAVRVDVARAEREHELLRRTLAELGADVTMLPFVHGAHDSVFIKDNAIVVEEMSRYRALLCKPLHRERGREQAARARALEALDIDVLDGLEPALEGGDVVVRPEGRGAFLGHGLRTSLSAAREVEAFLDADVVPLELVDERLYHLDTALAALEDGTVLACRDAFTEASWRVLALTPGVRRLVEVPLEHALAFGLNIVEVDGVLIVAREATGMREVLSDLGREVVPLPLGELMKGGGAAACLVSRVHEAPALAALARRRPAVASVTSGR